MGTLPTVFAGEVILTTDTNMQAIRAGPGRVTRIDIHDPDTGTTCLVLDELLELVERPRVEATPLPFAEPASIPNTLEAFEYDS